MGKDTRRSYKKNIKSLYKFCCLCMFMRSSGASSKTISWHLRFSLSLKLNSISASAGKVRAVDLHIISKHKMLRLQYIFMLLLFPVLSRSYVCQVLFVWTMFLAMSIYW